MPPTLPEIEEMARGAGEFLRAGYEQEHQVNYKGVIDLVTEIDHQSEAYLISEIQNRFPGHSILAEESGEIKGQEDDIWYIDPLDGTVNYAHGIPIFCVSIAYANRGTVQMAAVYDPMRDEMFTAIREYGAWLNGIPMKVSEAKDLRHSLLVTGFPYNTWSAPVNNLEYFGRFALVSQGLRRLGSAALDLCYVAAGRMDGYWELTLSPWDVAGGGLIAEQAGARVTALDGSPDYIEPPCSLLAASPAIHEKMLEVLNKK